MRAMLIEIYKKTGHLMPPVKKQLFFIFQHRKLLMNIKDLPTRQNLVPNPQAESSKVRRDYRSRHVVRNFVIIF